MKERFQNNGVLDNFYGLYYFENNGVLQKLLHQLKYENRKFIAEIFGDLIGNEIKENKLFEDNKLIIPIPLNKIKERERGYNQSLILAKRVSKILGINTLDNILFRKKYTKTQTQLNLQERKENIKDAFEVRNNELIKNQNIILVDDVITSGSTIEEAAKCLKNNGANKVISFSIAVAQLEDEIKSTKVEELEI
ncbi:MAG: ComF family protein [Bacteroidetes bacterium]|nr:ComF family protein [Bacteroidota bacterium]